MAQTVENEQLNVNLSVGTDTLPMSMSVPRDEVRLRRMLPVIQKISTDFIDRGLENIRDSGKEISCKAGCGACCRQLVPIAEAEAYELYDLIQELPEPRRSEIEARFAAAVEELNATKFFERLGNAAESESDEAYDEMVKEYFRFQIACPFLENESCSIHYSRPIACREYLVTSPAELCSTADGEGVVNVHHFFQVKEALISLSQRKTPERLPFVPLVQLVGWVRSNPDDSAHKTGREWMQGFFEKLAKYSKPV